MATGSIVAAFRPIISYCRRNHLSVSNEQSEHNVHSKHQLTVRRAGIEFRLKNESSVRPDLH